MKVFISWSGPLSKQVALLLRSWIEDVLQGTETWISTDDIDKGSLWFGDISTVLAGTSVGILCLTRENITAPWVLFEAGALSKGLSKSRVCPLLVNLGHTDLKPPLSQFNGTLPAKEDMLKLIRTINSQNGDKAITGDKVQKAFDRWWDDFDSKFAAILKGHKPLKEGHRRPTEDILEEILEISRSLQKASQQSSSKGPLVVLGEPGMGKALFLQKCIEHALNEKSSDSLPPDFFEISATEYWKRLSAGLSTLPKELKSEATQEKTKPEKGKGS